MKKLHSIKYWFVAACCIVAILQPASADPILSLTVGPLMEAANWQDTLATPSGNGNYEFADSTSMMGMWDLDYTLTANQDPFISANFTFKNTSAMVQDFILSVSLPITPTVVPSSLMGGSIGGSLTDANFDGVASLSTVMGTPMFNGEIDGAGVLPIFPHSTSFSTTFAGQTINIPATNVGLPGPTIPGPAALTSIGITHKFSLTPGDSVAFTSFFVVEAIPEPASAGLIALVSGGALFVRRRFVLS